MNESENINLNPLFKMNLLKQKKPQGLFILASVHNVKNVHI